MSLAQLHARNDQPVRISVGYRLQQDRIGHAENCRARTQSQRDRHHGSQRELRTSSKYPNGDRQISQDHGDLLSAEEFQNYPSIGRPMTAQNRWFLRQEIALDAPTRFL